MPKVQYLVHKTTKKRFRVVSVDKAAGTITLQGETAKFTERFDKDTIKSWGYDLETRDEPQAHADNEA